MAAEKVPKKYENHNKSARIDDCSHLREVNWYTGADLQGLTWFHFSISSVLWQTTTFARWKMIFLSWQTSCVWFKAQTAKWISYFLMLMLVKSSGLVCLACWHLVISTEQLRLMGMFLVLGRKGKLKDRTTNVNLVVAMLKEVSIPEEAEGFVGI